MVDYHLTELPPVYIRDPQKTELGRRMLIEAIKLIDEMGMEEFTFKRLAQALNTAEASVYRYFENKHRLLMYLVAWYWQWLEACLDYELHNLYDPKERLQRALFIIFRGGAQFERYAPPEREALHRLVIAEASKAYLTKSVDDENRKGLFHDYKRLCHQLADLIRSYRPSYPFPLALMSTVIETARKQVFFARHLPSLTEVADGPQVQDRVAEYLNSLVFSALEGCSEAKHSQEKSNG